MERTTVLLLFGGKSSEHDVSISSARNVFAAIDDTVFNVLLGYVDRHGKWWLIDKLSSDVDPHGAPQFAPVLGTGSFVTFPGNRIVKPDVLLSVIHGKNGEDGSVQGLAQLLNLPIVGCDVTASAITMDKLATKEILKAHSLPIVPYEVHRKGGETPDFNHLSMKLGSPMFVKPTREGSSIGVSKVFSEEELSAALSLAHRYDEVVLIERGLTVRELEVAILGNPPHHKTSSVGEIKPGADFYNYEAKYSPSSTSQVIIPADLTEGQTAEIREMAGNVYNILGCKGLARVDFFLADDGRIYVNELNAIPGFTNISMYPKLWREQGLSYSRLIERLISLALEANKKPEVTEE